MTLAPDEAPKYEPSQIQQYQFSETPIDFDLQLADSPSQTSRDKTHYDSFGLECKAL